MTDEGQSVLLGSEATSYAFSRQNTRPEAGLENAPNLFPPDAGGRSLGDVFPIDTAPLIVSGVINIIVER